MRRKVIYIILFIFSLIILTSCFQKLPEELYVSNIEYEQKIIETTKSVQNTNVGLVDNDDTSINISSATIIYKEKINSTQFFYGITVASTFSNYENVSVYVNSKKVIPISDYAINLKYDLAVFKFSTDIKFNVAKINSDKNLISPIKEGMSIISYGTDISRNYTNTSKSGFITNSKAKIDNSEEAFFTHDAPTNPGEKGSGVYNLEGLLVGMNNSKLINNTTYDADILGLNYALKIDYINNVFKNINKIDFENKLIDSNLLEQNNNVDKLSLTNYEKSISNVYEQNKKYLVQINMGNKSYSGIIINKRLNEYFILTKYFERDNLLKIQYENKSYPVTNVVQFDKENYVQMLVINTYDTLDVYDGNLYNNTHTELKKGQTVLNIGSVDNDLINSLNVGTLSKADGFDDHLFLHDSKTNLGQEGSPIFNLDGSLIGINLHRVMDPKSNDFLLEGISFALSVEYITNLLSTNIDKTIKSYESKDEYEKAIIKIVLNNENKTVTINTPQGHGSGFIYKKDFNNGINRYYVLTNRHVLRSSNTDVSNISLTFNFESDNIDIIDYYLDKVLDIAIIRFQSLEEFPYIESKELANKQTNKVVSGQTVIAIGTPFKENMNGFVTTGNLVRKEFDYDGKYLLGLLHTAPLNPGNSGGPLFDLSGKLIGVNVAKGSYLDTPSGRVGVEGMGVSLNINNVSKYINQEYTKLSYKNIAVLDLVSSS